MGDSSHLNQLVPEGLVFFRVTAGVNVWMTCMISIDRLLMVYYTVDYSQKETKQRAIAKICLVIGIHMLAAYFSNLLYYLPGLSTTKPDPLGYPSTEFIVLNPKSLIPPLPEIDKYLNTVRLCVDRLVPWLLCPATYVAVFVLRERQKRQVTGGSINTAATEARQLAEKRIKRSRRLVIGSSISLFVSLLPETVLDFSLFAFGYPLRNRVIYLGLIWFAQNFVDPVIYIVSLPQLSKSAKAALKYVWNSSKSIFSLQGFDCELC